MTTKHRHKTTLWNIGDTFKNPKFREGGRLKTFDRVVANPMCNQDWFTEADYANDEWDRFPSGAGFPGKARADWGWAQHMVASLSDNSCATRATDTGQQFSFKRIKIKSAKAL